MVNIQFKEVYKSFRKNLDFIWEDSEPDNKELLKKLMRERSFHESRGVRLEPTYKQLEVAWDYLKSKYKTERLEDIKFRLEKYRTHSIRRFTQPVIYKGKRYRKGQFVPKGFK